MAKVRRRTYTNKDGTKNQFWFLDYVDITGKRTREGNYKTKVDAEKVLAKIVTDIDNGTHIKQDKNITFAVAADHFLNLHASIHCKRSTYTFYKQSIANHLIPFFNKIKLKDITPMKINEFIQLELKQKLSHKSINHYITLLGSIFQMMVNEGIIYTNPVMKVKRLKLPYKEMRFLSYDEIHHLLNITKEHYPDFYPLLFTAIFTGMRKGELLALTWDKINWYAKKISVNTAVYKGILSTPKTDRSIRKIDMSNELIKVLKQWKLKCPISDKDIIFPNSIGGYIDQDNIIKRRFDPLLRKAGIERIRFHDLRHTYASILISKNVPIKYIQAQMGHSSIQVTLDNYGHIMPEVNQLGKDALDDVFRGQEHSNVIICQVC